MKMKIEIDLDDLINDLVGDSIDTDEYGYTGVDNIELNQAIKDRVTSSVISELLPKMKESIESGITNKIDAIIEERVNSKVDKTLEKILEDENFKFKARNFDGTIKDYIKEKFEDSRSWGNPQKALDKIAATFAQEMKLQYNTIFASRVVDNMRQQGLLKEDFATLLIDAPKAGN